MSAVAEWAAIFLSQPAQAGLDFPITAGFFFFFFFFFLGGKLEPWREGLSVKTVLVPSCAE